MITLDLGCCDNKVPGTYGVDIDIKNNPNVVFNLDKKPYPVKDNSVDRVYAKHILEHLNDIYGIFAEAGRILKSGGEFIVEVPHFSSRVAYSEPEHNRFYSYFMFDKLIASIPCEVIQREITFHKFFRAIGVHYLANKFPDAYERFWVYRFPAENIKLRLRIKK